jgi:hypothetical protein
MLRRAGAAYDISSIIVGELDAYPSLKTMSGKDLKGILDAANAGLNIYNMQGTTIELIPKKDL